MCRFFPVWEHGRTQIMLLCFQCVQTFSGPWAFSQYREKWWIFYLFFQARKLIQYSGKSLSSLPLLFTFSMEEKGLNCILHGRLPLPKKNHKLPPHPFEIEKDAFTVSRKRTKYLLLTA